MPSPRHSLATLSVLLSFFVSAFADTVTLKSGDKLEGRILDETDTELTIEVAITSSIKDQRVIKKADIEKVDKAQPDLEAWATLKNITVGEDSLEQTDYVRATNLLNSFVSQYPQSAHAAEAKKKIADLQEEAKRVDAGEMKVGGKWMTADEVRDERVQITGRALFNRMKRHAAAGQLSEAMNVFDAIEKSAPGSANYPDAVLLARQVLPNLKAAADQARVVLKAKTEEGKRRLQSAQGGDRAQLDSMQKQQQQQTEAMLSNLEKSGVKWLPLAPATDKSLAALSSRAAATIQTLNSHNVPRMRDSLVASERAKQELEKKDLAAAEKSLIEANGAWMKNEYVARYTARIAAAKTAAKETALADAAAAKAAATTPAPAKPKTTPAPTVAAAPEVVAEEPEKKGSVLTNPAFWVILVVVLALAALGMKAFHKFRDPSKNILDQE